MQIYLSSKSFFFFKQSIISFAFRLDFLFFLFLMFLFTNSLIEKLFQICFLKTQYLAEVTLALLTASSVAVLPLPKSTSERYSDMHWTLTELPASFGLSSSSKLLYQCPIFSFLHNLILGHYQPTYYMRNYNSWFILIINILHCSPYWQPFA